MSSKLPAPAGSFRRIILTGASGVGKTTLAEKLASELNLPIIPELARELCQKMGYKRIGEIPDQEGFKRSVLDLQIETEEKLGSFISDRSTIDAWVLWQRWNICSAMTYDTELYQAKAREQGQKYSQIIYLPPMFPPTEDDFRWTDADYQKQIDRIVRMTLFEWDLLEKTYLVQSSKLEERIEAVFNWLKI